MLHAYVYLFYLFIYYIKGLGGGVGGGHAILSQLIPEHTRRYFFSLTYICSRIGGMTNIAEGTPTSTSKPQNEQLLCDNCLYPLRPEHAHYRCDRCGARTSCCEGA